MVYATHSPLPEQLGIPKHSLMKRSFKVCSLVSSVVSGTEVCTFACDCGTFCSGIYGSVLSNKYKPSSTASLCEIRLMRFLMFGMN